MATFKTTKQFLEFLKMLSINGMIEEAVIDFKEGNVYSKFQDRDCTIRAFVEHKCNPTIECSVGIFKLKLLRDVLNNIGIDAIVEFRTDSLGLSNGKSNFRLNLCDVSVINRPEKVTLKEGILFPLTFIPTKQQIDELLSGCSLIESNMFRISGSDNIITFIAGEDKGDNFKYVIEGTTTKNLDTRFNKENVQTIVGMCKDKKLTISIMEKLMKIDVVDESSDIVACYMLAPIREESV